MKYKLCISIDEETLLKVKQGVRSGKYRNTSHAFEFAVQQMEEEQ